MDPQPHGATLSAASELSALVRAPHVGLYLQNACMKNVIVEADFGLFDSVEPWDLLCGVKDRRWSVQKALDSLQP